MRGVVLAAALAAAAPAVAQEAPPPEAAAAAAPAETPDAAPTEAPAVAPTVDVATRVEADGTTTMTHSLTIAAPPAAVWAAIATPEGWQGWAAPVARWVEGETGILETSYNPDEAPGGPGAIWQQFIAAIPGRLLVFRTIKAPDGFPHWDEYKKVTSFFELTPEGEAGSTGTRLTLTSTGYSDSEGGRALVKFFAGGNAMTLEMLRKHLAAEAPAEAAAEAPGE